MIMRDKFPITFMLNFMGFHSVCLLSATMIRQLDISVINTEMINDMFKLGLSTQRYTLHTRPSS